MRVSHTQCVRLAHTHTDLPRLRAAVVSSKGESLGDRVRELLHSGGGRREAGRDVISPAHLIVSPEYSECRGESESHTESQHGGACIL